MGPDARYPEFGARANLATETRLVKMGASPYAATAPPPA